MRLSGEHMFVLDNQSITLENHEIIKVFHAFLHFNKEEKFSAKKGLIHYHNQSQFLSSIFHVIMVNNLFVHTLLKDKE